MRLLSDLQRTHHATLRLPRGVTSSVIVTGGDRDQYPHCHRETPRRVFPAARHGEDDIEVNAATNGLTSLWQETRESRQAGFLAAE